MPIHGLSDRRRLPRQCKIRLGVKKTNQDGREYPTETDYFVIRAEDGATPEILELYSGQPKALKLMLPFAVDAVDPATHEEIIWNVNNRAYGSGGLKCKGTGLSDDVPGVAQSSSREWAERIAEVTNQQSSQLPNGRWSLRCLGRDCPKYHVTDESGGLVEGHDGKGAPAGAAACRALAIMRAFLLHPTDDENAPEYCRYLGVVELASGSRNTMIDVRSSLEIMAWSTGGRTAGVPFVLIRRPMYTVTPGGGKKLHFPCSILPTPDEWQRWATIPEEQVLLSRDHREELRAITAGGIDADTVRDLIPRIDAPAPRLTQGTSVGPVPANAVAPSAASAAAGAGETALTPAQRDELKAAIAGAHGLVARDDDGQWTTDVVQRLQALALAAHAHLGTDAGQRPVSGLQLRHAVWMRMELARGAQSTEQGAQDEPYGDDEAPEPMGVEA